MSAHDRFESLAGAVALGEATPQERALFDRHALDCPACREDAGTGTFVVAQIAASRDAETWRPSQPIVDRLRAKNSVRTRRTLGVLGWAVAASLVLNVAFAGGIGSRLIGMFDSTIRPPANVVAQTITLDAPVPIVAFKTKVGRAHAFLALPHHAKHIAPPVDAIAVVAKPSMPSTTQRLPTLDDIPDQLAGVDLYGTGTAHHRVAVESLPRCDERASDASGEVKETRPCRDAAGRVVR